LAGLFDAYIAVDWSARSLPSPARPSPDSIWVSERLGDATQDLYWRTRRGCRDFLEERIASHVDAGRRVLVGFDFAYGYPSGFAQAIGLSHDMPPWRLVWQELERLIEDAPDNSNNRFEVAAELNRRCGNETAGPFWGCPASRRSPTLESTSPLGGFPYGGSLERLRQVDKRVPGIQSAWQLLGRGSVGSQSLLGIPVVSYLRFNTRFSDVSRVWPFETGFATAPMLSAGPFVLHAEIWPSLMPRPLDEAFIKDQAQVRATTAWLAELDQSGALAEIFGRPTDLPEIGADAATREEGWVLGVR
jgi:hypothetical protein